MKGKELKTKIDASIEALADQTDQVLVSETMTKFLDTMSKFHNYSLYNQLIISYTLPDSTLIAGYRKWQQMGRQVRKGEKAIHILAPRFKKVETELENGETKTENRLAGFLTVCVFDISQTDGDSLPDTPQWISPEKNKELHSLLLDFATSQGIEVQIKELPGEAQGVSHGGCISLSPNAGTKTFIHEIAHELLHKNSPNQTSRKIKEVEAESVAYVVAKHLGIGNLKSPNYIALNGATGEDIKASMSRIRETAKQIIEAVDFAKEMGGQEC